MPKFYGNLCHCEEIKMVWSRKIEESSKFHTKTITQESIKKNTNVDYEFVKWFWENISQNLEIYSNQPSVNICKKWLNRYDYYKRKNKNLNRIEETIILSSNAPRKESKELIFTIPKKLEGAMSIPFNLDDITTFENSKDSILAFVSAAKSKKNLTLCIYQEKTKRKQTSASYGSCVVIDDQEELTNNQQVDRAIMFGMKGVDKDNPPQIPIFDQNKYKHPSSKQVKYTEDNDIHNIVI
ncbi:hypothetical protein C1645_813341 [Glomus cerebriforme]|uniref:Uncharacterized protein n=1 Tax=Glomus cerebriforme TaxID=658196 RepID=A0A397TND2_9GLOM|nr:hypothetical protein C1645_813341 [Glomus cerebriforme]